MNGSRDGAVRIPDITDVLKARKLLFGLARHTPLEYSHPLSDLAGARVYMKLENQQHAGSFKIRGAINKMYSLTEEERARGVITASSGNHAQGLATAAAMLGTKAVICVPETCPEAKTASVLARGGEYVDLRVTGAQYDDTERTALRMAGEEKLTFVSAYEDTYIAAGQGTLALEMFLDEPELDVIFCPLSGGGLLTGVAVAARALRPSAELWGTMAKNNPSWPRAWDAGRVEPAEETDSIADALGGSASPKLFDFIRRNVTGIAGISEEDIAKAMTFVHKNHHLVIEGAAGTAVAALTSGKADIKGKRVGVVISGGNVDDSKFIGILSEAGSRAQAR
ncbi:MAG: threonine/serine dehydratase [Synergistaceae bacterium]|jgi:threonine dehydratase|nr:threonine/serine dehydratase [Synergistaceae bacterium]